MPTKTYSTVAMGAETYRTFCWELSESEAVNAIRCDVQDQKAVQAANPGRIVIGVIKPTFIEVHQG